MDRVGRSGKVDVVVLVSEICYVRFWLTLDFLFQIITVYARQIMTREKRLCFVLVALPIPVLHR